MMRKTGIDIPGYIAEGCGKSNDPEFNRSISAAIALSNRLEYYAIMSRDLNFLGPDTHEKYELEVIEIRRMMSGLSNRLLV